jgi:carbon-monoxide dehydrogenase large subunit
MPGNLINPLIVEGQIHGGLAQGIGQALIEEVVYNSDGQLVTGSFMDYALPRATDFPRFELDNTVTPTPVNPLGAKGCGEAWHARLDAEHRGGDGGRAE